MSLLKKVAVMAAASVGWMGVVQATTYDAGTVSPSVYQQADFYSTSSFSFTDVFNFTVGTEYGTVLASAASYSPDGINAEQTHVSNLTLSIFAGSDATGPIVGEWSSSNGSLIDQSGVLAAGDYSVRIAGTTDGALGGGYQVSIAAVPEPAEWMMLLAGLAVLGFIAKRKTNGLMAG
jgi:hypothetical protein